MGSPTTQPRPEVRNLLRPWQAKRKAQDIQSQADRDKARPPRVVGFKPLMWEFIRLTMKREMALQDCKRYTDMWQGLCYTRCCGTYKEDTLADSRVMTCGHDTLCSYLPLCLPD